jgi:hypothetical protein
MIRMNIPKSEVTTWEGKTDTYYIHKVQGKDDVFIPSAEISEDGDEYVVSESAYQEAVKKARDRGAKGGGGRGSGSNQSKVSINTQLLQDMKSLLSRILAELQKISKGKK